MGSSISKEDQKKYGKNQVLSVTPVIEASIQKSNQKYTVFRHQFWQQLFSKFQPYHVNNVEALELLTELKSMIQTNFSPQQYDETIDACQEHGEKFQKLKNALYFKHKRAFQYLKFIANQDSSPEFKKELAFYQLKFDLSEEETLKVAAQVRTFCQNDMSAFAFLSLYLQISVTNALKKTTFANAQKKYNQIISKLESAYPANQSKSKSEKLEKETELYDLQKKLQLENISDQMQKVVYINETSHYDQLENFILKKAEDALKNKKEFTTFVKDIVRVKGYGFKTGVKIKSSNQKESLERTIEKIYESQMQDKKNQYGFFSIFFRCIPDQIPFSFGFQKFIGSGIQKKSYSQEKQANVKNELEKTIDDEVKNLISNEIQKANQKIKLFFQEQKETIFSAKDLLRGKCTFDTVQEIYKAAKKFLEKISEAKSKGQNIDLIELKDRLAKNTKDLVIIAKFNESIAEFQLALKLDSVSNEFNHKIYELKRSNLYSPIANLFILNEKWSRSFFYEQMDLYENVIKLEDKLKFDGSFKFKDFKNQISQFKHTFLQKNGNINQNYRSYQQKEANEIKQKFNELLDFIDSRRKQMQNIKKVQSQKLYEAKFWMANSDNDKAIDLINSLNNTELMNSQELLELKADNLNEKGQMQQAIVSYENLIRHKKLNKKNEQSYEFVKLYQKLGMIYDEIGDEGKSLEQYNKCLKINTKISGSESRDVAKTLKNIGNVYQSKGEYDKALEHYNKCLDIMTKISGAQSSDVAVALQDIADVYNLQRNYAKALEYYRKSLEIKTKLQGAESMAVAWTQECIGSVYMTKGYYDKSLEHFKKCLEIKTQIQGAISMDVAWVLTGMGNVYRAKQDYGKALEYYNQCLDIKTQIKGPKSDDVTWAIDSIGDFYRQIGNYDKALQNYQKSLEIKIQIKGANSIDVSVVFESMGYVYNLKNDYEKSLEFHNNSLKIKTQIKGAKSIDVANILAKIAYVYRLKGDHKKSQEYYNKSLDIKTQIKGANSIDVALVLQSIGEIYRSQKNYTKALQNYHKCLQIKTEIEGADSRETIYTLEIIGGVYIQKGDYDKSLEYYRKCLQAQIQSKGADSIDVAKTLEKIGSIYEMKKDYDKALEHFKKSMVIFNELNRTKDEKYTALTNSIQRIHKLIGSS